MSESNGVPIERAEVRHVGAGWETPGPVAERSDPNSNLPLALPGSKPLPLPEPPPPPPPPSEATLRERLADAIAAKTAAEQAMEGARTAHERGLRHVQRCRTAVSRYLGLDREIDAYTVEALRGAEGRAALSDDLRRQVMERDVAQVELASAERAITILLGELAQATDRHTLAGYAQTNALHFVLDIGRDRVAEAMKPIERKVAAFRQVINAPDDGAAWREVVARLLADPLHADLDVEVPDEPRPADPIPIQTVGPIMMRRARPLDAGDDWQDVVVPLEIGLQAQRAQAPTTPRNRAVEEFEATERARRQSRGV